ncbi:MAG: hypothetical protein ACRDNL_25730, partial [Spirillospora sp.]
MPEHLARLLAATPTLSTAWLAGVAAALGFALLFAQARSVSEPARLLPFLLLAPVLPPRWCSPPGCRCRWPPG